MPFDPKAYLKEDLGSGFNPKAYLAEEEKTKTSAGKALHAGAAKGATLGYLPEIQAAVEPAAFKALDMLTGGHVSETKPKKNFAERREEYAKELDGIQKERPVMFGVGELGGGLLLGGATAGLAPPAATTGWGRIAQGAKIGAAYGGLQAPSQEEGAYDPIQLGTRAKNAGVGLAVGGGTAGLFEGMQAVAGKAAPYLGRQAKLNATRALGRPTPTVATKMAKRGDDVVLGGDLLDEGAIPFFGTPGRIQKRVNVLKDKAWKSVEELFDKGGDAEVVDGAEAGMKLLGSDELQRLKDAGENAAVKAYEQAADELAGMGNLTLRKAQQIKQTLDERINFNKMNPGDAQPARMAKRTALRDSMDDSVERLGAGKNELKGRFKKYGRLEQASDILDREVGRTQTNDTIGLKDLAATFMGDTGAVKVALAAGSKAVRTFGNAASARSLNTAQKLVSQIPKLKALADKNPAIIQAVANRIEAKATGNDKLKEGTDPVLNNPTLMQQFEKNPGLIDVLQNEELKAKINKKLNRAPARGK